MRFSLAGLVALSAAALLVASLLAACGGSGGTRAATATVAATPTAQADVRHTNIPEVDAVIDAVKGGDVDALDSLVRYTNEPCVSPPPPVSVEFVRCPLDTPEGSLVPAFLVASCEGIFMANIDSPAIDRREQLGAGAQVYGVYRTDGSYQGNLLPIVQYAVVLAKGQRALALLLGDGGIVGIDNDCGYPPKQMVDLRHWGEAVLPPP